MKILKPAVTLAVMLALTTLFLSTPSFAEIPKLISYQGKLTDSQGRPLDGAYTITFRIYEQESGGSPLWYETQTIPAQKGIFSTQIGATKDLNLAFDKPYYLGIKVGSDAEMIPRQPLTSSGYAFRAKTAEVAGKINNYGVLSYDDITVGTPAAKNNVVTLNEQGQIPMTAIPKIGGYWFNKDHAYTGERGCGFNDNLSDENLMMSMALFRELCTGGDGGNGNGKIGGWAGGDPVPQYKKDRLKYTPHLICFGWGGGGGGGTRADASGGQGGGFLYIEANNITINSGGRISANGNSCNQTHAGGGGGGTVYLIYRNIGNNGIVEAVGGSNMGGSGQKGRDGTVILRKI